MEQDIMLSSHITEVTQTNGYGSTMQELFIVVDVSQYIKPAETRSFLITIKVFVHSLSYVVSSIFSVDNIDENGLINAGTIYILGPCSIDEIQYKVSLTYIDTT